MSDQAMKLFEALSGVDGELLERCGQKGGRRKTGVYRLSGKYGRAMAACVCLILVGVSAWSGYRLVTGPYGSNASGSDQSPAQHYMEQSARSEDGGNSDGNDMTAAEDKMSGNSTSASGGTTGGGAESGSGQDGGYMEMASSAAVTEAAMPQAEQDTMQIADAPGADKQDSLSSSGNASDSGGEGAMDKMDELRIKENENQDSRRAVFWEDAIAVEPFAGYVPTALPAGYEPFSARRSATPDQWNNMIFKWSDGEHIFSLDMTAGEAMTREDIEKMDGVNEYLAEEFRKELIPESMDGQIRFTIYCADGMRIEFSGYLTGDEMWDMAESVLQ